MKMITIIYNEAVDDEVADILNDCALKSYTKLTKTYGSGTASGTHLGNDIWPGLNNILYVACSDDEAKKLITRIRDARKTIGKEGVKAFVMPLEEIT